MNSELVDMTGRRFSRLLVLGSAGPGKKGHLWNCICDCGATRVANGCSLRLGQIRSCGCINREAVTKHGLTDTPEYIAWKGMMRRCACKTNKLYGGRGIRVCNRWKDFRAFLADMGHKPTPGHSLDRINGNGHYEPENCRWATRIEQNNNTLRNRVITIEGRSDTLANWVTLLNIHPYKIVHSRIYRDGIPIRQALQAKRRHNAYKEGK